MFRQLEVKGWDLRLCNIIEVGFIEKGTGKHQSNIVYSSEGIAPTVCASFCIKQPPTMVLINERILRSNLQENRIRKEDTETV